MNYAFDEKLRLVRWLLPQLHPTEMIALELAYKDVTRKADLAVVGTNSLVAIELKGPRDNLGKVSAQISDYLRYFLAVDVAVAPKFLAAVRSIVPKEVGIIELGAETVVRRRKATPRKILAAEFAAGWLRSKDMRRLLGAQMGQLGLDTARKIAASSIPGKVLTAEALRVARDRADARYKNFLAERGERLTLDDIATLELPSKIR